MSENKPLEDLLDRVARLPASGGSWSYYPGMALGRTSEGHGSTGELTVEVTAVEGYYGRLAPPPAGAIYIRDPGAARAKAIRDSVALYVAQGKDVPEHLQALYDALDTPETDLDVDLVDAVTGAPLAEVDVVEERPSVAEFTPVSEDMPEVTPIEAPEELRVAELKAELDARGIAYPAGARKAELVELLQAEVPPSE